MVSSFYNALCPAASQDLCSTEKHHHNLTWQVHGLEQWTRE